MFAKPVVGVVTKCDLANQKQIEQAGKYLNAAGAEKLFFVSSVTGQGVDELVEYLQIL